MIERIRDVPAGTIGLRATGKLTRRDYHDVLEPALNEGVESGELRLLFVLVDFDGLQPSAWLADIKTGLSVEVKHRSALEEARAGHRRRLGGKGDARVRLGGSRRADDLRPRRVRQGHGLDRKLVGDGDVHAGASGG